MYISKPIQVLTTQGSLRRLVVSAPKDSPTLISDPAEPPSREGTAKVLWTQEFSKTFNQGLGLGGGRVNLFTFSGIDHKSFGEQVVG